MKKIQYINISFIARTLFNDVLQPRKVIGPTTLFCGSRLPLPLATEGTQYFSLFTIHFSL